MRIGGDEAGEHPRILFGFDFPVDSWRLFHRGKGNTLTVRCEDGDSSASSLRTISGKLADLTVRQQDRGNVEIPHDALDVSAHGYVASSSERHALHGFRKEESAFDGVGESPVNVQLGKTPHFPGEPN